MSTHTTKLEPRLRAGALAAALVLAAAPAGLRAQAAHDVDAAAAAALHAAQQGDRKGYFDWMGEALEIAPEHPYVLYHYARAAALAGRGDDAIEALARAAAAGIGMDPAADTAFAALQGTPRFRAAREHALGRATPITRSDTAFVLRLPGLVPENLAFDPRSGTFLVGDLNRGRIVRAHRDGRIEPYADRGVVGGRVVGMKADTARGLLWVAVGADTTNQATWRPGAARTALLALDLATGAPRHRYVAADSAAPHFFNDVVLDAAGTVYMSDSEAALVYRLADPAGPLEVWLAPPRRGFTFPNGIALAPDGRTLYVAHQEGVSAVDVGTRRMRRLRPPAGITLTGFDGMYAARGRFFAIQNGGGVALDRVVAFTASPDGAVGWAEEIERRHPAYRVPTTGVVVGDSLYYIANAQLDRLNAGTAESDPPLDPIVVLRLPLPGAPAATR